ncbi:hypothetical protein SEA_KIKO_4 [Gordonia phage Kiko]|nr:hypothetical protein SEA_KIKO_4 [Gordonia phage Kiko]
MVNTDTLVSYDDLLSEAATAALTGQRVGFASPREYANAEAFEAILRTIQPANCTRVVRSQYRRHIETIGGGFIGFFAATREAGRGFDLDLLCLNGANDFRDGALESLNVAARRGRILRSETR